MTPLERQVQRQWAELQAERAKSRTLKPGGGGGSSGDMEARVAKLESDIEHVKKTLDRVDSGVSDIKKSLADMRVEAAKVQGEIKTSLASLDERSKHLPTRYESFGIVAAVVAVLGGAIALAARFIA